MSSALPQVACLRTGCAVGTYSELLVDSIGDLPSGSEVCRPCDELCAACLGPGTTELICPLCTFATRIGEGCIRECDNFTGECMKLGGGVPGREGGGVRLGRGVSLGDGVLVVRLSFSHRVPVNHPLLPALCYCLQRV